jgi:hypothetical protein
MILVILMFLCALALSGAAAFYSIVGLMAIFAAAPMPIAIMGSILEGSKLVIASWLYRNWSESPKLMRGYLTTALVILMFLTSMGIFGFLSKAHMDQAVPTGDVAAQVALIDEKIATEKENLNAARKAIAQLDEQVNQTISRTTSATDDAAVNRSIAIRRGQAKERMALSNDIGAAQSRITKLTEEKAPLATELRKVEAEVGPIKYIAALIYGEEGSSDSTLLEKAVRWVTILIVSVFDPLAVVLLIAANWSLSHFRRKEQVDLPVAEPAPPIVETPLTTPKEEVVVEDSPKRKKVNKKEKPAPEWEIAPPPQPVNVDAPEHPDLVPGNQNWGSRPPEHLTPRRR